MEARGDQALCSTAFQVLSVPHPVPEWPEGTRSLGIGQVHLQREAVAVVGRMFVHKVFFTNLKIILWKGVG